MGAKPPKVSVRKLHREGWSGRYDPKKAVVHLHYGSNESGPDLRKTLLSHELAHWASRVVYCDKNRRTKSCTYRGQHDPRFYKVLKKLHKDLGTSKYANVLEKRAGYKPPDGWLDQAMYMAAKRSRKSLPPTKRVRRGAPKKVAPGAIQKCIRDLVADGYDIGYAKWECNRRFLRTNPEMAKSDLIKKIYRAASPKKGKKRNRAETLAFRGLAQYEAEVYGALRKMGFPGSAASSAVSKHSFEIMSGMRRGTAPAALAKAIAGTTRASMVL